MEKEKAIFASRSKIWIADSKGNVVLGLGHYRAFNLLWRLGSDACRGHTDIDELRGCLDAHCDHRRSAREVLSGGEGQRLKADSFC